MTKKLNWGIIGTGGIANEFASQFDEDFANLASVVSRSQTNADAFADKYNIPTAYSNYDDILNDPTIDIVYIATPHNKHYEYIYKALSMNKHVCCEKVIVLNNKQLSQLLDMAKAKNLYIFEAMTIHYMPIYSDIKKWINSQDLGPLKMVQANFGSFKNYEDRYFFKKDLAGGALFDIGVYALNFVRYFLSKQPNDISTHVVINEHGVDESSTIILKNDNDELASIALTFRAKMPKVGIVAYEEGYFTFNQYPSSDKVTFTTHNGDVKTFEAGSSSKRLSYEVSQISEIILKGQNNPYIELTRDVIEIMDIVRDSWGLEYDDEGIY